MVYCSVPNHTIQHHTCKKKASKFFILERTTITQWKVWTTTSSDIQKVVESNLEYSVTFKWSSDVLNSDEGRKEQFTFSGFCPGFCLLLLVVEPFVDWNKKSIFDHHNVSTDILGNYNLVSSTFYLQSSDNKTHLHTWTWNGIFCSKSTCLWKLVSAHLRLWGTHVCFAFLKAITPWFLFIVLLGGCFRRLKW